MDEKGLGVEIGKIKKRREKDQADQKATFKETTEARKAKKLALEKRVPTIIGISQINDQNESRINNLIDEVKRASGVQPNLSRNSSIAINLGDADDMPDFYKIAVINSGGVQRPNIGIGLISKEHAEAHRWFERGLVGVNPEGSDSEAEYKISKVETYKPSDDYPSDESSEIYATMQRAVDNEQAFSSSGGILHLAQAIKKARTKINYGPPPAPEDVVVEIMDRVMDMHTTLYMVEMAARKPELNPFVAQALTESPQQLEV